jgi:uncharacterized membrane protein
MKIFAKEAARDKELHVSIYIVIYKFMLGVVELLIGLALTLFGSSIYRVVEAGIVKELSEDPHDLLARIGESLIPNVLTHGRFVIASLIILGVAKIAGAIGLMYKQNWGVDLLVGLTVLMAPFQIISLILHPHAFDLTYFLLGLVIALYLVEFRPGAWISRIFGVRPTSSGS